MTLTTTHRETTPRVNWDVWRTDMTNYQNREKLSNTALAHRIGISLGTLTRYLNGERNPNSDICLFTMVMLGTSADRYVFPEAAERAITPLHAHAPMRRGLMTGGAA